VLISGSGRTLKNFIDLAAAGELPVDLRLVISSSRRAGGLQFADAARIPSLIVSPLDCSTREEFSENTFEPCREAGVDYVCMAGYLRHVLIPPDFENRVLNIHPALLPALGGKGLYGERVHEAVLGSGVRFSGCTVHFADNVYDHGPIIHQQVVPVLDDDTPDTLATRVFEAEKQAYPHVLRQLASGGVQIDGRRVRIVQDG
jgi:phosphoribosylglycinamide formyltransferase-1